MDDRDKVLTGGDPRVAAFFERIERLEKELRSLPAPEALPLGGEYYMTDRQVVQTLHVSRRTLQQWRSDGRLPYFIVANKTLYRESDIKQVIEEGRRQNKKYSE